MNQVVKFKNSGFCKFLEEIGEEFEYIEEVQAEKKQERSIFGHFWVLVGLFVAYLGKELILVFCAGYFVFEALRESIQKVLFLCVKKELELSKQYFLYFYSEKAGDQFWEWTKEYCKNLEKELEVKLFQAEKTSPWHFERVLNSIELNCLIKSYKSVWGVFTVMKTFLTLKKLVNKAKGEIILIKVTKIQVKSRENLKIPKFFHLQKQIIETLKGIKSNSYNQEELMNRILAVKGLLEIDLNTLNQRQYIKKGESKVPKKVPDEKLVIKIIPNEENQEDNIIFVIEGQGEQEIKPRIENDYLFIGEYKTKGLNRLDLKEFIKHSKEKGS